MVPTCDTCGDSGTIKMENGDAPCHCNAGNTALFNHPGVEGVMTGLEIKNHFQPDSPEPIELGGHAFFAKDLPERRRVAAIRAKLAPVLAETERSFVGFIGTATMEELFAASRRTRLPVFALMDCQTWAQAVGGKIELPTM